MKKTLELHEHTGLSVMTIVRDKLGKIVFAETKDFENLVIEGKSLMEMNKQSVHKWVNENLSLSKKLPEAKYFFSSCGKAPGTIKALNSWGCTSCQKQCHGFCCRTRY